MRRFLSLLTIIMLVGSASVLGTMAYERNAAPAGQGITQNEYQRSTSGALEAFSQNKPFFPASYDNEFDFSTGKDASGYWTDINGAVDKIVKVKNNGNTPCYFRTLFAFQDTQYVVSNGYLQINWNQSDDYKIEKVNSTVDINGVPYIVYAATYKKELPAGAESPASLLQFALKSDTPYGNMVGEYRILAVSQAYWVEPNTGEELTPDMLSTLLGSEETYEAAFEQALTPN